MRDVDDKVERVWGKVRECSFPAPVSHAREILGLLTALVRRESMMFGIAIELEEETRGAMIAAAKDILLEWYRFHAGEPIERELWDGVRRLGVELGVEPPASVIEERREHERVEAELAKLRTPFAAIAETLPSIAVLVGRRRDDRLHDHWRAMPREITPWFAPVWGARGFLLDPELLAIGKALLVEYWPGDPPSPVTPLRHRPWAHFRLVDDPEAREEEALVPDELGLRVLEDFEYGRNGRSMTGGGGVHPYAQACLAARRVLT